MQNNKKAKNWINKQVEALEFYHEMVEAGIPKEDARYVLPLSALSNITILIGARELFHLKYIVNAQEVSASEMTKRVINRMYLKALHHCPELMKDRQENFVSTSWYPCSQLFASPNSYLGSNKTIGDYEEWSQVGNFSKISCSKFNHRDMKHLINECYKGDVTALSTLKHFNWYFYSKMSIAAYIHAIRQRTWDVTSQSLYSVIFDKMFSITAPTTIKNSKFDNKFRKLSFELVYETKKAIEDDPDNLNNYLSGVPHCININTYLHINGWNALHAIGKRTCNKAQWDIKRIARLMAKEIIKDEQLFEKIVTQQCNLLQRCPERKPCKAKYRNEK